MNAIYLSSKQTFFLKNYFYWRYIYFTMLCQFPLYSKVSHLYVYLYPLFFGFPSHLGRHRALDSGWPQVLGDLKQGAQTSQS